MPGGSGFKNAIANALGQLVITALMSPNFVAGTSGWIIRKDGSVEFNFGTFRGVISAGGLFIYDTVAAFNTLLMSLAPADGTDSYGNTYRRGLCFQPAAIAGSRALMSWAINDGGITIPSGIQYNHTVGYLELFSKAQAARLEMDDTGSFLLDNGTGGLATIQAGHVGTPFGDLQWGSFSVSFSASASAGGTLTYPNAFRTAAPALVHGILIGSNLDICLNWQSRNATSASWRAFQNTNVAITGSGTIFWAGLG